MSIFSKLGGKGITKVLPKFDSAAFKLGTKNFGKGFGSGLGKVVGGFGKFTINLAETRFGFVLAGVGVPVLGILSFLGWNVEGLAEMTGRTPAEVAMGGGIITIILGSLAIILILNRNKQTPQIIIQEVIKEESSDKELAKEESIKGV
tara:strand:- start:361 stop:804 length:444 start_codon:yes stop_codon:yes gene_type:complete